MIIDRNLKFNEYIKCLGARLRRLIVVFKALRQVASKAVVKSVYNALCQSLLTDCITSWGSACKTNLLKKFVLPFYYPTVNLSKKCEVYDSAATLYVKLNIASKQHYPATFDIEKKTKLNIVKAEYSRFHCAT